jgi:hypothetical protein
MKLGGKEDGTAKEQHAATEFVANSLEDHIWASRKAYQTQKKIKGLSLPNNEFLQRKRMSKDEPKHRVLTLPSLNQLCARDPGNTSARHSARSRKSLSPGNS